MTSLTDIGVPEVEALVELVLDPVHLGADDAEECLAIDKDLDAVLLDLLVEGAGAVDVLEVVGQAAAPAVPHTDLDQLRLGLVQQRPQLLHRRRRQLQRRLPWP